MLTILVHGGAVSQNIVALAADDSYVYWLEQADPVGGDPGAVRRIDKHGNGPIETLVTISAGRNPHGLLLDNSDVYILSNLGLSWVSKTATHGFDADTVITGQFGIVSSTGTRRGNNPLEMAIDPGLRRIYVSNLDYQGYGSIQSVSKINGQPTTIRQVDGAGPIATDHRSVYWFESLTGEIVSAPLTGGSVRVEVSGLPTGFNGVRALRTDIDGGLYWGEGTGAVRKFVGGTVTTLAMDYQGNNSYGYAAGFAVDPYLGNVYYATSNKIKYVPKAGGTPQVFKNFVFAADLAVDNNFVFTSWVYAGIDRDGKPAGVPIPPNRTPVLQFPLGGTYHFSQNGPAVVMAPGAVASDPDSPNFNNGNLTVSILSDANGADTFEIAQQGQIGLTGSTVTYGGVGIGTFTGGSYTTPLVVTFNANASSAAVQALVRAITFRTSGVYSPEVAFRTVQFQLTDSDGRYAAVVQNVGLYSINSSAAQMSMYRAYNPHADYHFFTTAFSEFGNAVNAGYRDESSGRAGFAVLDNLVASATAIHRMYNPNNGRHYYTVSDYERDVLVSVGWRYEKDEGFMYTSQATGTSEIFRLYNHNSGVHLYTDNAAAKDAILQTYPGIWVKHDSLGYAFSFSGSTTAQAVSAPATAEPIVVMTADDELSLPIESGEPSAVIDGIAIQQSNSNDWNDDANPADGSSPTSDTPSLPSDGLIEADDVSLIELDLAFSISSQISMWE